ncbi:MAG: protein jag, partial [Ilumatobacteraceae bacterium]
PSTSEQGAEMTAEDVPTNGETRPPEPVLEPVDVDRVRDAALEFVGGLTGAFGFDTSVDAEVDGTDIEVRVSGESLGLLIGPGGRTLLSIQDLARVAAQRRLGDHDTRLRVDVAGYREKRKVALQRFATSVAEQVRTSGIARSLDAMPSADRKVLHDALAEMDGVSSRSEGEDPNRRVVVTPTA